MKNKHIMNVDIKWNRCFLSVECNELDRKQAPIVGIVACMVVKIKMQYCCTMVAWECRGSWLAAVACKLGYLKLKAR